MGQTGPSWLLCLLVAAMPGATALRAQTVCPDVDASVETDSPELAARVCAVVEEETESLAQCNLVVPLPLTIEVQPSLEQGCLGLYHCDTSLIELLDPASFAEAISDQGPFAAIPVEGYYDSIVAHELAHAAYDERNCPLESCLVNQEFIAYAMQVRSLSPEDRALFEAASPINPDEALSYLSEVMHAMAPQRFATTAWWHFARQQDPCGYVGSIVAGDVLLDRERP